VLVVFSLRQLFTWPLQVVSAAMQPINILNMPTFSPCAQGVVSREVTIMREMRHPNVLPLLASFTAGQHIWMVSPYYSAGSLQSIIEYAYPQVRGRGMSAMPSCSHVWLPSLLLRLLSVG